MFAKIAFPFYFLENIAIIILAIFEKVSHNHIAIILWLRIALSHNFQLWLKKLNYG